MSKVLAWIDKTPLVPFLVLGILLGLAPFQPEPHLWEKLKMLAAGELQRPIDIFDLFLHGAPVALLIIKLSRMARAK
ncbi:MAG: RND transporter [Pseudomonadota bacterium]|nr:MAG: RND transporter [Pseudomonadota bacterium]